MDVRTYLYRAVRWSVWVGVGRGLVEQRTCPNDTCVRHRRRRKSDYVPCAVLMLCSDRTSSCERTDVPVANWSIAR